MGSQKPKTRMWYSVALGIGVWGAFYGAAVVSGHGISLFDPTLVAGAAIYALYMKYMFSYVYQLGVPYIQYIFGAFLFLWVVGEQLLSFDVMTMLAGAAAIWVGTVAAQYLHKYIYWQ